MCAVEMGGSGSNCQSGFHEGQLQQRNQQQIQSPKLALNHKIEIISNRLGKKHVRHR